MSTWDVILLAIVQGLTEFLPVSSSGHLVVVEGLVVELSSAENLTLLNVLLHAGTLAAVLVVYWHRIWRMLGSDRRVIGLLAVGTLPAVLIGLPLEHYAQHLLESPLLAGGLLILNGVMLATSRWTPTGEVDYRDMTHRQALLIGLAQAVAVLPGISRSGSTIVTGMCVGLRRDAAATFSFLLAIPVISGAVLLPVLKGEITRTAGPGALALMLGIATSFAVGLAALLWLLRWLQTGRLYLFAAWCIPLGIAVVAWQLLK